MLYTKQDNIENAVRFWSQELNILNNKNPQEQAKIYNDFGVLLDTHAQHLLAQRCYQKGLALNLLDEVITHNLLPSDKDMQDKSKTPKNGPKVLSSQLIQQLKSTCPNSCQTQKSYRAGLF